MVLTSLALWLLVVLPAVVAKRLAEASFPTVEPLRRLFIAVWLYVLVIHFQVMLLGKAGQLTLGPMLLLSVATALASLMLPRPDSRVRLRALVWDAYTRATPHERMAGLMLAAAPLYALGFLMLNGQIFMWDDWAYHGPAVSGMMRSDSLEFFRHNFAMYYPFNPHLLNVYCTLPTGDLQWAWLPLVWWVVAGALAWAVLASMAPRRCAELLLLAGAVCLMSQNARWFLHTMGSTDLQSAIGLLSGIALARPRPGAGNREVRLNGLMCGLVIGYTMGVKSFFVLPGAIVALMCLYWSTWGRMNPPVESPRQRWTMAGKMAGLGALGIVLTGSYWYVKNLLVAGNPLFPVDFLEFSGPMTRKAMRKTAMVNFGDDAGWSAEFWRDVWSQYIAWPEPWGWVFTIGLLVGLALLAARAMSAVLGREPASVGHLPELLAASAVLLVAYPHLPYSGTWIGHEHLVISRRYLFVCFFAGFAAWGYLGGVLVGGRAVFVWPVRVMLYLAFVLQWPLLAFWGDFPEPTWNWWAWVDKMAERLGWMAGDHYIPWDPIGWVLATVLLAAMVVVRLVPERLLALKRLGHWRLPFAAPAMAALMAVAVARPHLVESPYMRKYPRWDSTMHMAGVWAADHLPPGSRVGTYANNAWETWSNQGSRAQLVPVYLHSNGMAQPQLHEAYLAGLIDPDDDDTFPRLGVPWQPRLPRPDLFGERLCASGVDYVHFAPYFGWGELLQLEAIRSVEQFAVVYDDGYNVIYQHLDEPNEALTPMPAPKTLPSPAEWRGY